MAIEPELDETLIGSDPGSVGPSSLAATASPQPTSPQQPVDVAAWASEALQSLNLSSGVTNGTGVPLSIPLDQVLPNDAETGSLHLKRALLAGPQAAKRRDRGSLTRREALLRGREGTRQRRRWENDHFKNVPNAEPPLPSDWAVQPTHPVVHVPYHLARFWDDIEASRDEGPAGSHKRQKSKDTNVGRVTREVRESAKRNQAFKGWVRSIEEPVRWFVENRRATAASKLQAGANAAAPAASASATTDTDSISSSVASLVSIPTSPGKEREDMEFVTDNSDDDMVVFRHSGGASARMAGLSRADMAASMSASMPFALAGPSQFRPPKERKSVLALQREEDWEELLPVGTKSRSNSAASSTVLEPPAAAAATGADVDSWRVVPGRTEEDSNAPAAMLFAPEGSAATYKRWIVHFVAAYYGLYSASVNDSETMRRYVFVGPRRGKVGKKAQKAVVAAGVPLAMWEQL